MTRVRLHLTCAPHNTCRICARALLYLQNNACNNQSNESNWDELPSSITNCANHQKSSQLPPFVAVTCYRGSRTPIGRRSTASRVHLCSGSEWLTLSVQGHHPPGKGGKFDPLSHGLQSTGVFSPNSLHRIFPHFGLVCFCCFWIFPRNVVHLDAVCSLRAPLNWILILFSVFFFPAPEFASSSWLCFLIAVRSLHR